MLVLLAASAAGISAQLSPQAAVDELLNADRAFSVASDKTDLVTGISAMFADEVIMPNPAGVAYRNAKGDRGAARQSGECRRAHRVDAASRRHLRRWPSRLHRRLSWRCGRPTAGRPARSGTWPTGRSSREDGGCWSTSACSAKAPPSQLKPMANVLPRQIVAPSANAATIEQYRKSLADAETAFSNEAQKIGIERRVHEVRKSPRPSTLAAYDVQGFLVGNEEIGKSVGAGAPPTGSPVSWGPDKTIVAASGDFGVTIGYIVANAPGADGKPQPRRPFFTIWRRDSPKDPWRYIAEGSSAPFACRCLFRSSSSSRPGAYSRHPPSPWSRSSSRCPSR